METTITMQIINGNLRMPTIQGLKKLDPKAYHELERMFQAMWYAWLNKGKKGRVSLPYWAQQIRNPRVMNIGLKTLSRNGWIYSKSLPNNNWGEAKLREDKLLEYVDEKTLNLVRRYKKFVKYQLEKIEDAEFRFCSRKTKVQGAILDTGIERKGFEKEGRVPFQLDLEMLEWYKEAAIKLVNKGIRKTIEMYPDLTEDKANFEEIGKDIISNYLLENATYISGNRTNDPRGRDNKGFLNKIGNPVNYKIIRSLLVIPEEYRERATLKGVENIYLHIGEILGFKNGTKTDKINYGRRCYYRKVFKQLDLNVEKDLDKLFENVWLERLYKELDTYFGIKIPSVKHIILKRYREGKISLEKCKEVVESNNTDHKWGTPVEIDMSASVLGFIGLLLGHRPFLERCNMIGNKLQDAWHHPIITNRKQFKTIMRSCYGSRKTAAEMWTEMKIPYTGDEVKAFNYELIYGELAVANAFKNFLIEESNPKEVMDLEVWNQTAKTYCNRYKHVGEKTIRYDFYDTQTDSVRRITNTTVRKVPDLNSFRRYFPTGLIHALDSQVMDRCVDYIIDKHGWCLSIHDALLVSPETATPARQKYASILEEVYENRKEILTKYMRSIGVKPAAIKRWKKVEELVVPLNEPFKCNEMVLK